MEVLRVGGPQTRPAWLYPGAGLRVCPDFTRCHIREWSLSAPAYKARQLREIGAGFFSAAGSAAGALAKRRRSWNTCPMPDTRLETTRLVLRPYQPDDLPALVRLAGAREVAATTLRIPHPYTEADALEYLAACQI